MERESFGSKTGFIFATAASAIGLGNFWRFPYLVQKYGGGTFIFIFLVASLTFGLALTIMEVAIGRKTGKSIIEALGDLGVKHRWIGIITLAVPITLLGYYCNIGGWVLKYAFTFITGDVGSFSDIGSSSTYFEEFVANSSGVLDGPVIWFIIFFLLSTLLIARGVKKGVEMVSKLLMPVLLVLMIILIVFVFTIPGIDVGLAKTFVPTMDGLTIDACVAAVGQVFFSMSLGIGILITYGSYLDKSKNVTKIMRTTAILECIVSIACALLIVPIVFTFPGGEMAQGTGLMFKSLPVIFMHTGHGRIIGALFFVMVFFAAWTSSVSITEAIVAPLMDSLKMSRRKSVFVITSICSILGILACLSFGSLSWISINEMNIQEFMDFFASCVLLPLCSILLCIIIGHVLGTAKIIDETGIERESKYATYFDIMVKYVSPLILLLIMISGIMR